MMPSIKPPLSSKQAIQAAQGLQDGMGKGLDQQILLPVAAMIFSGVSTTQSCQGHQDHGLPYPWIHFADGESQSVKQLLQHYPLPCWQVFDLADSSRLLPSRALVQGGAGNDRQVITLSVMPPQVYATMGHSQPFMPQLRAELVAQLAGNQKQINHWAKQLLS